MENEVSKAISLMMEDARDKKENAAYGGSSGDGGYSMTECFRDCFLMELIMLKML